jgi:hypothetical protein
MDERPDLEKLSAAEKVQMIRELWPLRALVRDSVVQVTALQLNLETFRRRWAQLSRH